MEATLMQAVDERPPTYEVGPSAYIDALREFICENASVALRATPTRDVKFQMMAETEKSRQLVGEALIEPADSSVPPKAAGLIGDNFPDLMARVVKLSDKARNGGANIAPFHELSSDVQDDIRQSMLDEYLDMCAALAATDGRVSRIVYQSAAILYRSPENVRQLIYENDDLGRSNITRVICQSPLSAEELIEKARDEIEAAIKKFPTIPHNEICGHVLRAPNSYEIGLREYAKKHGLVVDVEPEALPDPASFLEQLRKLLRSRKYPLEQLNSPAEARETARRLGEEAVGLMDKRKSVEGLGSSTIQDPGLRQHFQKKAEQLALAANRAWRQGDLPVSPEKAPLSFRKALYGLVLGEFLLIHAELDGDVPLGSIKSNGNPVLFYGAEDVKRMIADNPDLSPYQLKVLLHQSAESPEEAVADFRARVEALMKTRPRLLHYQAAHIALRSPHLAIPSEELGEPATKLPPHEFLSNNRLHLTSNMNLANVARDIQLEIENLRSEISDYFQSVDWEIAGLQVPEAAREVLLEKVEKLIVASERVYRKGECATRLSDYSPEERHIVYGALAEEYVKIGAILGSKTARNWQANPVLYISPEELGQLRSKYDWMKDWAFHRVVAQGYRDVGAALARVDRVMADLNRLYPDLPDTYVVNLAVCKPTRALKLATERIKAAAEKNYQFRDTKKVEPSPNKPEQIYKHLRNQIKHGWAPDNDTFDTPTERRITTFRDRATAWVAAQDTAPSSGSPAFEKFLDHLEYCVRASESLSGEGSYPSVLRQHHNSQESFIRSAYSNQLALNELVASAGGNGKEFRTYGFGFMHDATYLQALWRQYEPYMTRGLITYVAITSPRRPINKLNELIDYRARLMIENPDLGPDEVSKAVAARVKK